MQSKYTFEIYNFSFKLPCLGLMASSLLIGEQGKENREEKKRKGEEKLKKEEVRIDNFFLFATFDSSNINVK